MVHSQDIGWTAVFENGAEAGTIGKRMEAFKFKATSDGVKGTLSYRAHVQNIGWMAWQNESAAYIGTTGQGLRMEAFEIKLTGDIATKFDVRYRAYVKGIGWQDWVSNGATAGTVGQARQIEQISIELVPKAS